MSSGVRTLLFTFVIASLQAQSTLELGKSVQGTLVTGKTESHAIGLQAGQYVHATIARTSLPLVVRLHAADSKENLVELNLPPAPQSMEPLCWIAKSSGEYRIDLSTPASAITSTESYEIKIDELRAAEAADEKRLQDQQLFEQARAANAKNDYRLAITNLEKASALGHEANEPERASRALFEIGAAYTKLNQYQKAIDYYEQALALERKIKDRRGEGATLLRLGNSYESLSKYDKAIGYYEQALKIQRAIAERKGEGDTLQNLGHVFENLGKYEKAIECYTQALEIQQQANNRRGQGQTLNGLGNAHENLNQFEKAIGYYEQALKIRREINERGGVGQALSNLGNAYLNLGQYDKAVDYYEQALPIRREAGDRRGVAITLRNMGTGYHDQSQYEKAIGCYEQALAIFVEINNPQGQGDALLSLGNAYADLNQYEKAIDRFSRALRIKRDTKEPRGEADTLLSLGDAHASLNQYDKAIESYKRALRIERGIKDRQSEGYTLIGLAHANLRLSRYRTAIAYCGQAATIHRDIKDPNGEAEAIYTLGEIYIKLGRFENGIANYERSLAILREAKNRKDESAVLAALMSAWASQRPRLGIFYGKQSVNTIQSIRTDIRGLSQEVQKSFLKGNEKPYHALAELLIAQGRLAEAEEVLALLKEEEYFQYIRRDAGERSSLNRRADLTADEAEWESRWREIGDRLMEIGAQRGELLKKSRTPMEEERLTKLEADIQVGNQKFEQFLDELGQHFSAKADAGKRIEDLRETQGIMENLRDFPAGTVAIFTLAGEDKLYLILRSSDAQKAFEYPIKAADLNRKVLQFRTAVRNPALDPRPLGLELYDILVRPMLRDLTQAKARTLMWSLDGTLRYLPLAALYDGKQYLIEQYRTSIITLASSWDMKDRPDSEWKAAGFGVTKAYEGFLALPSVSSELAGIIAVRPGDAGAMSGEVKLDDQFTRAALEQTLRKRYPVVHIASHFQFRPGDNTDSFLLLGDGAHLSMADLKTSANRFGGVQLLTLSACNTGVGDGAEVEGFGTLAQRQGAKSVIASLWPVADESTSRLMQEFYRIREAAPDATKLEALREAQLALLEGKVSVAKDATKDRALIYEPAETKVAVKAPKFSPDPKAPYAHPYYWAPFFLMGNWL